MSLPILLSVPHDGRGVPVEVSDHVVLSRDDLVADADTQAREVYDLDDLVAVSQVAHVARAFVDLNRPPDDRRPDGAIKTHTCWGVPVYAEPLPEELAELLIERYHRPYHARLSEAAGADVLVGVDGHTMAAAAPPVGPDEGVRPELCVSDAHGTLPEPWLKGLLHALREAFGVEPSHNRPFRGGYITQMHSRELPWVQIELSRGPWMRVEDKHAAMRRALTDWTASTLRPMAHLGRPWTVSPSRVDGRGPSAP